MASGTIPSRPAKPHPDRLKIMHLFPDRPLVGPCAIHCSHAAMDLSSPHTDPLGPECPTSLQASAVGPECLMGAEPNPLRAEGPTRMEPNPMRAEGSAGAEPNPLRSECPAR